MPAANAQAPMGEQNQSAIERMLQFGQRMTAPHATITQFSIRRRVQLLNALAVILTLTFASGLLTQPAQATTYGFLLFISAGSYLLGKSRTPRAGTFLFSFGFLSATYLTLYFNFSDNYSAAVLASVPIALIVASAITSPRTFAGLAIYAALATFLTPLYLTTPGVKAEFISVGSLIAATGAILYGIRMFQLGLENFQAGEVQAADQETAEVKTTLEERRREYAQKAEAAEQQILERSARLRNLAELSQEISASVNRNPDETLTYFTQIISQKLGFYHVGIFLLDKNKRYAELRAANSKGGQRMLERRHQLKVGGTGIVGYVSQSGYARIALSTGMDAVFFNNPDLPETQSEMALPIKTGTQVIGVLDVQSPLPAAFHEEDTHTFTTLANQIALVIQNMQTGGQAIISGLPSQATKAGEVTSRKEKQSGYAYLADGTISAAKSIHTPALDQALASGESVALPASSKNEHPILAIPVKVRDLVIGYIHIEAAEVNRKWTEDEIAMVQSVSERAALALENARLFEETERRAEQEQNMARVTARIGEGTSFERIMQTTIQEIGRTLGAKRTFIQLESPSSSDEDAAMDRGN